MKLQYTLLSTLLLSFSHGCGGPSSDSTTPKPVEGVAEVVEAPPTAPAAVELAPPTIPSSPVDAPESLQLEIVLANPNKQLTQVGTFIDAVQPGMGSFVTPTTFLVTLGGMAGTAGIAGVDLNAPVYALVLDKEQMMLVVTLSSEAELRSSLEGGTSQIFFHEGFASIGKA